MKKKMLICLLLLGFRANTTQAQVVVKENKRTEEKIKLTFGVALEANFTNFLHSGIEGGRSDMRTGTSVGGFINLDFPTPFSVQGEMLFHYKTSHFISDTHTGTYQYWGVEIPIYVMYTWKLKNDARLNLAVGPYTNWGFGAHFKEGGVKTDVYEKEANTGLPIMKDSDTGFGIKLGYEFASGIQLNIAYKVSVTNVIDANSSTVKMRPQTLAFGIAYRWRKS